MRLAASKIYQWNDGVIDYGSAAFGVEFAEAIKGGDVGDYVPLQRVFDDLNDMASRAQARQGSGGVLGGDPIKALRGSSRRIRDPFQTMVEKAEQMVLATHRRYVLNQLLDFAHIEGIGHMIEEVDPSLVPQSVNVQTVIQQLKRNDFQVNYAGQPDENGKVKTEEDALSEFLTFFTTAQMPNGPDPILPVYQDGKIKWYHVDHDLYDALAGLEMWYLPRFLDMTYGASARLFRLGTTGLRPSFSLITNPIRDVQTFFAQSRTMVDPARMMLAWLKSMGEATVVSVGGPKKMSPYLDAFRRLGGEMALPLGQDSNQVRRAVSELFQGRVVKIVRNPLDHARDVLQIPEAATRTAEFKLRAKELGWSPGQMMTHNQALQLLLDGKRVTTDFTSAGSVGKKINQVVPFFNAVIQGARAFIRAFRQNPTRAMVAAGVLALFSLWRWWELRDEEWYQDMPYAFRYLYWYFPTEEEDGPVYVIPRPFDWANVFSVMPEAFAHSWYTKNPEEFSAAMGHIFETSSPLSIENIGGFPVPTDLFGVPGQAIIEQAANYDYFFDSPIVPLREQGLPEEEQVGPYTSLAAQGLGRIFDISPRRLEFMARSFTGGLGPDVLQAGDPLLNALGFDDLVEAPERDFEPSDVPILGKLVRRGGREGFGGLAVDEFYEVLEDYQKKQRSKLNPETEEEAEIRLMMTDATRALSKLYAVSRGTPELGKRQELQRLVRFIAMDAVQRAKANDPERKVFKRIKGLAEDSPEELFGLRGQLEQ